MKGLTGRSWRKRTLSGIVCLLNRFCKIDGKNARLCCRIVAVVFSSPYLLGSLLSRGCVFVCVYVYVHTILNPLDDFIPPSFSLISCEIAHYAYNTTKKLCTVCIVCCFTTDMNIRLNEGGIKPSSGF